MSLSSLNLDAFAELARVGNFSKAAKNMFITQSALSQRVKNLEEALESSLVIREPLGIRLTPAGESLLKYCLARFELEKECIEKIRDPGSQLLTGALRIGGFSTIMRSVVLPIVSEFAQKNAGLGIELFTREMRELPQILRSGEAEYVFLDHKLSYQSVESEFVGNETNLVIRPTSKKVDERVFIDHDPDDSTTLNFLRLQRKSIESVRRIYLDEIYGIIDGVAMGLGRAVVPEHLVRNNKAICVDQEFKAVKSPVFLNYYSQSVYSNLQKAAQSWLKLKVKDSLGEY